MFPYNGFGWIPVFKHCVGKAPLGKGSILDDLEIWNPMFPYAAFGGSQFLNTVLEKCL
jgi:hypothetical protein